MQLEKRLLELAAIFQKYKSPITVATRMAQFVLESRAGQSDLFKKSNNGFGIKASPPWVGDKVLHESIEADGKMHASYFRKFPSLEASIKGHARLSSLRLPTVKIGLIKLRFKQIIIRMKRKD